MAWHYVNEGEATGPVSDEELLSKWRSGQLLPRTLVWREGMTDWQPASVMVPQIVPPPPPPDLPAPLQPRAAGTGMPPVLPTFFCTMCGNIIPADQLVRLGERTVCAPCKPRYVQHAQEGLEAPVRIPVVDGAFAAVAANPGMDLADPFSRFMAHILDCVFVGGSTMALWFLFSFLFGLGMAVGADSSSPGFYMGALSVALTGLAIAWTTFYWVFFIGRNGSTPGMKLLRVKMVRADRRPVGYGLAFGRLILYYVINSFTMGLTNLTALFDREKRTVTDALSGTRVVHLACDGGTALNTILSP